MHLDEAYLLPLAHNLHRPTINNGLLSYENAHSLNGHTILRAKTFSKTMPILRQLFIERLEGHVVPSQIVLNARH